MLLFIVLDCPICDRNLFPRCLQRVFLSFSQPQTLFGGFAAAKIPPSPHKSYVWRILCQFFHSTVVENLHGLEIWETKKKKCFIKIAVPFLQLSWSSGWCLVTLSKCLNVQMRFWTSSVTVCVVRIRPQGLTGDNWLHWSSLKKHFCLSCLKYLHLKIVKIQNTFLKRF